MATLLHGPRLGPPACPTTLWRQRVWLMFDSVVSVTLQTRVWGATAWTTVHVQSTSALLSNTIVLISNTLLPSTKYEYRVLAAGVEVVAPTWFRTMPDGAGDFVVYQVSDGHDVNDVGYASILADYTTNYEPLGIPAFIVQLGDLYVIASFSDAATIIAGDALPEIDAIAPTTRHIPFCYMFDDWDWGGNNSASDNMNLLSLADARLIQDTLWYDHPRHATPSYAYALDVAGVPFIVTDQRSQRLYGTNIFGTANPTTPVWNGTESPRLTGYTLHGAAQVAWLKSVLVEYASRGFIFYVSPTSFRPPRAPRTGGSAGRDGISLYHGNEQIEIVTPLLSAGGGWRNNLVVLSGDDHYAVVDHATVATAVHATATNINRPGTPIGLPFLEVKTSLGGTLTGAASLYGTTHTSILFGTVLTNAPSGANNFGRWLVTSRENGAEVIVDFAILDRTLGTPIVDASSRTATFYGRNGIWRRYDVAPPTQNYPPENAPRPGIRFERSYIDEVSGALTREGFVTRDYADRLVARDNVDEPGRDELLRRHHFPHDLDDLIPPLE